MPSLTCFIPCIVPTATSQGKGVMVIGGKPRFFKKKRQQQAENSFFGLLQPHAPPQPFEGPLTLVVTLYFPWRKSEKKSVVNGFATYPIQTRPDLDNIFKAMADVMTTLRFWNDDGQISSLCLHKAYSDHPGIRISLTDSLATTRDGRQEQVGL